MEEVEDISSDVLVSLRRSIAESSPATDRSASVPDLLFPDDFSFGAINLFDEAADALKTDAELDRIGSAL